jgi:DNA-binding NarL/FixJ family response regulator
MTTPPPLRVVLADDAGLVREGLARLLTETGIEVAAQAATAGQLLAQVNKTQPDVAVVDIRMPPTFTNEGLIAAAQIRQKHPRVAVLILSQHVDISYAMQLITQQSDRVGYLLKDRVVHVEQFTAALRHLAAGGCVIDPALVAELINAPTRDDPLAALSNRERDVLSLLAEGRTDRGIAEALHLAPKTVETHVRAIFRKLNLPASDTENRRILAVLTYLRTRQLQSSDRWSS